MKNQKRQFVVLLALAVFLCAAYAGVSFYNQRQREQEQEQQEKDKIVITQMETSEITAFSYMVDGQTLSFTRNGENWSYDGDAAVDIQEDAVETMLADAVALTAEEEVDDYERLSDFGLEQPLNVITLKTSEKEFTLYVGDKNAITNLYYLKTADSDVIYQISAALPSGFTKTIEELTAESETETEE